MRTYKDLRLLVKTCLVVALFVGCDKEEKAGGDYDVNTSLTLFKLDNKNNSVDLSATDTVASQSGVTGKFIPVNGAVGAAKGLETIRISLYTLKDSLLNTVTINSFYKPEYHVINTPLLIPASQLGKVYKVEVDAVDKSGTSIGKKQFFGVDVVTCDPLPPCLVNNQITVMVETPPGTPEADNLYLFGSVNGWNRGDVAFKLTKNPLVPNCYCVTIPFPPGYSDWQVNEVYVTRGLYENDGVNPDGSSFIAKYTTTAMGPLWEITVPKWRDR